MRTPVRLPGRRATRPEEPGPAMPDGAVAARSRRRRTVAVALGTVTLAAAGVALAALLGGDAGDGGPALRGSGRAVAVTRQTLVERETVQGTLGYAGTRTVLNRLGGSGGDESGDSPAGTDSGNASAGTPSTDTAATIPAAYFVPDEDQPDGERQPESKQRPQDKDDSGPEEGSAPGDSAPGETSPGDTAPDTPDNSSPDTPDNSNPDTPDNSTLDNGSTQDPEPAESPSNPAQQAPDASAGSPSDGGRAGQPSSPQDDEDAADGSPSPSDGSNTVTALARPGSVVRRGGTLYRLDGDPIVLMYGSTPAYRDLGLGVEDGRDVRQLERNLAQLGFDPGTVDSSFTSTTAAAVSDWQESVGLSQTGSVEVGRVVFLPGARRIGEHTTELGSVLAAGAEVLDTSSTRRVVTIELDAALQSLARKRSGVEVTLPDQSTVRGRITDVGRVAREKEDSSADAGAADPTAEPELVIDVTVRLRSARGLGRLDEAPVSVGLAQESRKNVLSVPVNALVARRGGYGVELAVGGRIVPVRTGLFAGGYVEVAGAGIREGTRVVVPDA
jgi:Putative peptidoglycan binding domain